MLFAWKHRHEDDAYYKFFKNILGFTPRNLAVYKTAFIHRSCSQEASNGHHVNNERLEYLGDAVLGAIVAEYLYKKYPYEGEGFLTITRSKIVSRASLGKLARKIGLIDLIQYNRSQPGVFKSLEGDVFEALIGAIYIEKGFLFTRRLVINKLLSVYVDVDELVKTDWNYKGMLIDWGQHLQRKISFEVERTITQGNNWRRQYEVRVYIDGKPYSSAINYTIKSAEQLAAEKTYKYIQECEASLSKISPIGMPDKVEEDDLKCGDAGNTSASVDFDQ